MSAIEVSFESTQTMTQAEFAEWVEDHARWDLNHYELLNGRIVMHPPAGFPHGGIDSQVQRFVGDFVDSRGLGYVFGSSQGYDLPTGDTLEPDCSFVSRGRWSAAPPPEVGKFLRVVPDLVVEVLSLSTRSRDRGEKKAVYERNGVCEYWLIDHLSRNVTRFRLRDGRYDLGTVYSHEERLRSEVLEGFDLAVADLFPTYT